MAFLNPGLLWGSLLFLVPIIIYLIFQRKIKEMDWAAMQFLMDIMEQKRKTTIEDLLLLLLRILMILFLALAVARPLFQSSAVASLLGSDADVVILLDNTYSMGASQGGQTRWERAKEQAIQIIEEQSTGSGVALLLGSSIPDTIIKEFSSDHTLIADTIRDLPVSALNGDWASTFATAKDMLATSNKGLKKLYIISDFQAYDWEDFDENTKSMLKELHNNNDVTLINLEDNVTDNLTAIRLRLSAGAMRVGSKATFAADIYNHGSDIAEDIPVDFLIDGSVVESSTITIASKQSGTVRFPYEAIEDGYHQASIKIRGDSLAEDNKAYLPFKVVESISILAVSEGENDHGFLPTQFIELALNPYSDGSESDEAIYHFNNINVSELAGEDLQQYEFVCMSGVSAVSSVEANIISEYVQQGGGVLMFLGPSTDVPTYNSNLHKDGKGLFAWPLSVNKVSNDDEKDPIGISTYNLSHPIWLGLVDHQNDYFKQVNVYSAFTFQKGNLERALPLADLILKENDDEIKENPPLIVDFSLGRGHCIVVGTSSDLSMNDFITRPVFVGFINQCVKYTKTFRDGDVVITAGTDAVRYVDYQRSQANYACSSPSGNSIVVPVNDVNGIYQIQLPEMREAGIYELVNQNDSSDRTLLGVNMNVKEGNIVQMSVDALKSLFPDFELKIRGVSANDDEASSGSGGGAELASLLLLLVLICWIGENYLGYRISKR